MSTPGTDRASLPHTTGAPPLSPMTFRPMLMEKVWGGDRLSRFGKVVAPGARIGESWELADMASTSASGAGGAAAHSVIETGPMAGRTLREAIGVYGHRLLGSARPMAQGGGGGGAFPLLIKYLDAREDLSVQVHPSPEYARTHPGAHLKTECWYILHAEPGARIYKGVRPGVTREAFESALRSGSGQGVVELLGSVPAVAGECHNLPSGTVHALGAGVLVAEVQTPSDTTFRVYDWGRTGRELHIEQALACIEFHSAPAATRYGGAGGAESGGGERGGGESGGGGGGWHRLVTTSFFTLDEVRPGAGASVPVRSEPGDACIVLMCIAGAAELRSDDGSFPAVALSAGRTVLVPAEVSGRCRVVAGASGSTVLRAGV